MMSISCSTLRRALPLFCVIALLLLSAGGCGDSRPEFGADLERLGAWMTGSFSSAEQAQADTTYFDIRLHMARIWRDRGDAIWLYVEQSVAAAPGEQEKPYRQRVYRLTAVGERDFDSAVFELPDPENHVGDWSGPDPLADLGPEDLTEREGCTVHLHFVRTGQFTGSTKDAECKSTLRGATYATSHVTVYEDRIVSWDQRFDATGAQVWGATERGYVFLRVPEDSSVAR